jgi:predicted transport protein
VRAFGDDVTQKTLKYYIAYRRLRNFLCVEILAAAAPARLSISR